MTALPPDRERWRRLEAICDGALKLPPAERPAYVAGACGDDAALKREVEALLAHEHTAERFLDATPGSVAASVLTGARGNLVGGSLGDYEITARLGEGGMGAVYRARDRKLGRDVAIKLLPEEFAADPERLKRFEREARLLATLNHPNIGAIYGLLDGGSVRGLVLELIDGQTLAAALDRGPLPLARALSIAAQITDALDHAHRRGITHRDLKPSNVMLMATGVKLLDFGVGKLTPRPGNALMTGASTLTAEGAIVGTLHYMAPEQLEGKGADARSDIFAFGAVLFEMLTGKKAFDGASQASIIAAVIEAPAPRLSGVGGAHAAHLERIVNKCLAKNPDERWQSGRDLGDALLWLAEDATRPLEPATATAAATGRRSRWLPASAAVLAFLATGTVAWDVWSRSRAITATPAPVRFELHPESGQRYQFHAFDVSSDGTQLAYSDSTQLARTNDGRGIWIRRFDRLDPFLIPGTAGAGDPRFSPDGQWIAYVSGGTLRKVRVSGDTPPQIVGENIRSFHSFNWTLPGTILIGAAELPLRRFDADTGAVNEFSIPSKATEVDHHSPFPLPGGTHMLLAVHGHDNRFSIAVQTLDGTDRKTIVESGFAPTYSPTGHLVFARDSTIFAAPFDLTRRELTGPQVAMIEHVDTVPTSGEAEYRLSSSGVLVYVAQPSRTGRTLTWVDPAGRQTQIPLAAGAFSTPRVSPDGSQLAFVLEQDDGRRQIWTYELASGKRVQVTRDGDHWAPLWAPSGHALVYAKATSIGSDLIMQAVDGGQAVRLGGNDNRLFPAAFAAGEQRLIVSEMPPSDEYFLSQLSVGQPGAFSKIPSALRTPREASLSPDGRWIAFTAFQSRMLQVFIQGHPPTGEPRQVTIDGGRHPVWSHDGRRLFYRSASGVYSVAIDTARGLTWKAPQLLFEGYFVGPEYDVAPDGRFVMITPDAQERAPRHLNVVMNWGSELLSRVPVRR